jgi:hypothetical protein
MQNYTFFLTWRRNNFSHYIFFGWGTRCPKMTDNGMAAWRSGGFYALLFKLPLPAAVAPNRSL